MLWYSVISTWLSEFQKNRSFPPALTSILQMEVIPWYFSWNPDRNLQPYTVIIPWVLIPSDFPIRLLFAFLDSSVRATWPTILILLDIDHPNINLWNINFRIPHHAIFSSHFLLYATRPKHALLSPSICVYPSMWEREFHTHKTSKIKVWYYLFFTFLDSRREDKKFWTAW
jgi:hypothetical protein